MIASPMTPSSSAALRIHARLREAAAAADAGSTRHVPGERIIAQALDVAFWASLRREEGVAPTISLALAASEDVAQPLRFARPLPLAAGPLAKLAPAVKRPGIHLGIWTGPEGAAVWGTTMDLRPRTLVIEVVADKNPALDSVNDAVQTFVRPTAGGIVFGSGTAAQTATVTDPGAFAQSGQWIPVMIGVAVALVVSLTKSTVRPAANVATAGVAAPVLSTVEDIVSIALVFVAILVPVLVLVAVLALAWAAVRLIRRRHTPQRAA